MTVILELKKNKIKINDEEKTHVETYICDTCKKENRGFFDNDNFEMEIDDWITITDDEQLTITTDDGNELILGTYRKIGLLSKGKTIDFCSKKCAQKYLLKNLIKKVR